MEGSENRADQEVGRLRLIDVSSGNDCLIDVSSENDCLIGSPSENQIVQDYFELSVIGNTLEREDAIDSSKEREQDAKLSESWEQERTRKVGCNLRKSLAWDSAFFTSAGVLDPEELSTIHCGLKKADTHPLPGILEDIRRSAESNSTLDSDNFTLESLEVGLFDDIRASIQKSSKAANAASHSGKALPGESGVQTSRKTGIPPCNRIKPISVSKGQSINTQIQEKTKKGTAKPGETNSLSHKPPKITARANSSSAAPTKRTSLGANRVIIGNNSAKAISGRGKTGVLQQSSTNNMSVTSSSSQKSSSDSSSSATKVKSAASFVHHTRSGSTSSDSTGKSPLKSLKNKKDSRDANRPSGSILEVPLSIPTKNKTASRNARVSAYLMSMSKANSISPASSIDGWSTESSSSTSTINQRSNNSKKNADISSPRKGFSSEREARQTMHLQTNSLDQSGEHGSQGTRIPSESVKKQPLPSAAISHTASKDVSKSFKPSGLRMPSPKIGFFDAEKSAVRTPTSGFQCNPGEQSCSPKSGAKSGNLTGGALIGKPTKHQSSRTSTVTGSINFDSRKAGVRFSASSMRHTSQPQELSNASPEPSSTSSVEKDRHSKTSTVKNYASHSTGQRSHLKSQEEDKNTDNSTLNSVLDARESSQVAMNDSMGMKSVVVPTGYEITHAREDGVHLSTKAGSGSSNYNDI